MASAAPAVEANAAFTPKALRMVLLRTDANGFDGEGGNAELHVAEYLPH